MKLACFLLKFRFMKNFIAIILTVLLFSFSSSSNLNQKLPNASFKTLENGDFTTASILKDQKPAIISFWSTTCVPCIKELIAINKKYDQIKNDLNSEVYAISTDDENLIKRVPKIVSKKGWKFPVLTDTSKDLFTQLKAKNVPFTIVVDKTGKIVYEHSSYTTGDENKLIEILKSLQ